MSTIESKTESLGIEEIAKNLNDAGIPPDFGDDNSRLLIKMWRTLGQGQPVTHEMTAQIAEGLGIPFERADAFLRQITERDSNDNIIGLLGLSLNQEWAHRLIINGRPFRTWCAWDTLFLPAMLGETVVVESESPLSGTLVRLTVTPHLRLRWSPQQQSTPKSTMCHRSRRSGVISAIRCTSSHTSKKLRSGPRARAISLS